MSNPNKPPQTPEFTKEVLPDPDSTEPDSGEYDDYGINEAGVHIFDDEGMAVTEEKSDTLPVRVDDLEPNDLRKSYESYFGVCDVYSPEEARAMAEALRSDRKNPNRKIMIGVMTHPVVLSDEIPVPEEVRKGIREVFPTKEEMSGGFTDDPDVFNTVHYADLYGPDGPWKSQEAPDVFDNLELVVQYGGEHLHAIQLDLTWPAADELERFKSKYPDLVIVLQVGKFALEEVGGDHQAVVDRLREYGDSVDYALLDMSMGMGTDMETEGLLSMLRTIRGQLPELGLAVAGGLGPDSVDLLEPIAREFPDVSIDAQGNLKHKDAPRDDRGHLVSTYSADLERSTEYIRRSCEILDSPNLEQDLDF